MSEADVHSVAGIYTLTWEQEGVALRIERLREDSHYSVRGEATMRLAGKHVHQARFDLTATRSRQDFANQCGKRSTGMDWDSFVEEASIRVLDLYRAGEPVIDLATYEMEEASGYLVPPLLLYGQANLLFGPGGSGKSYIAAFLSMVVGYGLDNMAGLSASPGRVLYLDYETSPDEITRRLRSIKLGLDLTGPLPVLYRFLVQPLAAEIEVIQRIVVDEGITMVVVDSVGYACGGAPEEAVNAIAYYGALRSLKVTTLSVGHVTKDWKANTPFGSVYWLNGARSAWEVVKSQDSGAESTHIGMLHRKINNGPLHQPFGFEMVFDGMRVTLARETISMVPDADDKLPMKDRITSTMQRFGPMSVTDLVEYLEKPEGTIRKTLHRSNAFVVVKGGKHNGNWTLAPSKAPPPPQVAAVDVGSLIEPEMPPATEGDEFDAMYQEHLSDQQSALEL